MLFSFMKSNTCKLMFFLPLMQLGIDTIPVLLQNVFLHLLMNSFNSCVGGTRAFERGKAHICTILVYTRALGGCHGVLTLLSYSWHLEIRRVMLGYVVLTTNQIICSCFNNSGELTAIGHRRHHYRMISEWLKWRRKHRQRILH